MSFPGSALTVLSARGTCDLAVAASSACDSIICLIVETITLR